MRFHRHLPLAALSLLITLVIGCASQTAISARESIDEGTGTTISQLDAPIQLLATQVGTPQNDPFAFAAPFETDRMGARQTYLWIAVPAGSSAAPKIEITLEAAPLTLSPASNEPAALGLRALPYGKPAAWSAIFVYLLDEAALRRLEKAHRLTITVTYSQAGTAQFTGDWDGSGAIASFRRRIGLADPN